MFGHLPEFIIVVVLALIVFGPEKFPELAAQAGKLMREVRETMDTALNPTEVEVADDFDTYYYESLARSGDGEDDHELSDGDELMGEEELPGGEELVYAESHQTEALSANGTDVDQGTEAAPESRPKQEDRGPATS